MNEMFSQGGKGSTGILTNKQAIARKFGVKQNEVVYFSVGVDLGGYKVIYDKSTQRAYSLPVFPAGTAAVSLSKQAVLVHSAGTVDLGELAATRREFVCISDSFTTGLVVNTRNELLMHNGIGYTYLGALPVTIAAGTNPVGNVDWKPQTDPGLREDLLYSEILNEIYNHRFDTMQDLLASTTMANGYQAVVSGFYSAADGGGGLWVRESSLDGGVYSGVPVHVSGSAVIYNATGSAYKLLCGESVDLKQLGAQESVNIDSVYAVAEAITRNSSETKRITITGQYTHTNPLVVPAGVFIDFVDYQTNWTKKITNNTSGLPTLTGSYGGNLVMDVDACFILDHGYGHRMDNFNIKCDAPLSVEHAIYHGFTRETNIAQTIGRIGESGTTLKYKPMHGITAQQGFAHNYGNITAFTQKGTWNYIFNTAGTGCNLIKVRQSWNYDSTETAIRFQGSTNLSLGQQYCEQTKQRIYEFYGCTGGVIDVLSIDSHECNQNASALYTRNSQITLGALTVNAVTVATGVSAKFIEHTVGTGIYGCLTINGITARTNQLNVPNLTTITKDTGGVGNNCAIRGMPIPPIGALGNMGATDVGSVSHESDTGIVSTPHYRNVTASFGSQASSARSSVVDGFNCWAATEGATVLSSTLTKSAESYEVCGGYGGTTTGTPTTSNRKWSISSLYGTIKASGAITNGASFADYAEYFENAELGVIPLGTLVDLIGDKVVPANGDDFVGVVSGTAGVVLNSASLVWSGKYLTGDHGEPIYEYIDGAKVRKINPDYSPEMVLAGFDDEGNEVYTENYIPREERPDEWSCVGLIGQVYVNVSYAVKIGDWLTAINGVGVPSETKTRLRVMSIVSKGIAKCMLV